MKILRAVLHPAAVQDDDGHVPSGHADVVEQVAHLLLLETLDLLDAFPDVKQIRSYLDLPLVLLLNVVVLHLLDTLPGKVFASCDSDSCICLL